MLTKRLLLYPRGGEHAHSHRRQLQPIGAVVKIEFVQLVGIRLLDAPEAERVQFPLQLRGRKEQPEGFAGRRDPLRKPIEDGTAFGS